MKNRYKVLMVVALVVVFTFMFIGSSYASNNAYKTYIGEVVELIDGEAMEVKIYDNESNNQTWKIRLTGIKTNASEEAYQFVNSIVKNNIMIFKMELKDNEVYIDNEGWRYANIYSGNDCINETLLLNGMALLDTEHKKFYNYAMLENNYAYAKDNEIGIHGGEDYHNPYIPKVNINLAKSSDIYNLLDDTDSSLASKITSYIKYNKINNKKELKFVSSEITNQWLDENKSKISLVTNLNTAEENELKSLFKTYKDDKIAEDIISYRMTESFDNISQLKKIDSVTDKLYKEVMDFISVQYHSVYHEEDAKVVNINTASRSQIDDIPDMSKSQAKNIIKYRDDNKYSYKSKEELKNLPSGLSSTAFNKIEDNIVVATDINNALDNELESLFGRFDLTESKLELYVRRIKSSAPYTSIDELDDILPREIYNEIKPFIYVGQYPTTVKLNINLATQKQLENFLGLSEDDAEEIIKYTKRNEINSYEELDKKVDLSKKDAKITLYTNINRASIDEFVMMHEDMSRTVAKKIVEYREEYPFASDDEVKEFFISIKEYEMYKDIMKYIIYR